MDKESGTRAVTIGECEAKHKHVDSIEKRMFRMEIIAVTTLLSSLGTLIVLFVTFYLIPG